MTEPASALVIVLLRAPSASGKTRLTAGRSDMASFALRTALAADTLAAAAAAGYPMLVSYTPDGAADEVRELAAEAGVEAASFLPQRGTDLGARMRHAFDDAFATGAAHVVLVGSDLPSLPPQHVSDAVAALMSPADVVLGPTEDGGYYLVGVSQGRAGVACEALFGEGVPWGTPDVLAVTLVRLRAAGLLVELAPPWFDVDEPGDLARVAEDAEAAPAPRTCAWIEAHAKA